MLHSNVIMNKTAVELANKFTKHLLNNEVDKAQTIWNEFIPTYGGMNDLFELTNNDIPSKLFINFARG